MNKEEIAIELTKIYMSNLRISNLYKSIDEVYKIYKSFLLLQIDDIFKGSDKNG